MFRFFTRWRATLALAAVALGVLGSPTSALAQPTNDDFSNATVISSLPFSDVVDNTLATRETGEPFTPCSTAQQTVWYEFTPTSGGALSIDMAGSSFSDTVFNVYREIGTGFSGLNWINCAQFGGSLTISVQTGGTYYIQAGDVFGTGGSFHLNVQTVPAPGNDDFANATSIGALPFSDTQDLTGATVEAEPAPGCFSTSNTVWYSYTPGTTESVTATTDQFGAGIAAYTGSSLASLSQVSCAYSGPLTFRAQAGITYFFQVGAWCCGGFGTVTFRLQVAANPVAQFSFSPSDPNSYDTIQFYDQSGDPAGVGISSWAWDFGDGGTSTLQYPSHRYAADGDYTVQLTVTTSDGRTASTSQVVQVRTHDVSIIRLAVPGSAHVGQTIAVNVYVRNKHYPETVQVDLYKSIPGGFNRVGSLTESVPVKPGGQSTRFAFTYTVTSDDKTMGKITFRADATIIDHRDALPADNVLLSTPVMIG
jgi:PKD repeat protein